MVTSHNGADSGPEQPEELLWNIKTVILKTGLSRPSIYRYMKRGCFPPRRRVGPNRVAWVPAEVVAWIERCPRLDQHRRWLRDDRSVEDHEQFARAPAALPTQDINP
ncbi:MAG TPA: AlpA family phage regulatory protein [Dongiaceae bacterium]|jgi:predicted DNA-binding transcriptional regulator AlpA